LVGGREVEVGATARSGNNGDGDGETEEAEGAFHGFTREGGNEKGRRIEYDSGSSHRPL
jgi:hypothetical protein